MTGEYRRRPSQRDSRIDYSRGNFFITICLADRKPLFGKVDGGRLCLNAAGEMIQRIWLELPKIIPGLVLDCHVVMPDHFHAVLAIVDTRITHPENQDSRRPLLTDVMRVFKSLTARAYGVGVRQEGWESYRDKFWQEDFWDHLIEDEADLHFHREYVVNNPMRWYLRQQGML